MCFIRSVRKSSSFLCLKGVREKESEKHKLFGSSKGNIPGLKLFKRRAGFTLLELLSTTALMVVIGAALYAVLSNGIDVWKRTNEEILEEKVSIFFEKIAKDMRNTFSYKGVEFLGEQDSVSFPTLVISPLSHPNLVANVGKVNYFFDKKTQTVKVVKFDISGLYTGKGREEVLLKNVKLLKFRFYSYDPQGKEYFWYKNWQKGTFPLAVGVEIIIVRSEKEFKFERVIQIPIGS